MPFAVAALVDASVAGLVSGSTCAPTGPEECAGAAVIMVR
jgi:hypothetical protein